MTPMRPRPNILIICTDQQSAWTIGAYGGTEIKTPNLDRLAAEGTLFTQYFSNSARCKSSRACMMTGRYPYECDLYEPGNALGKDQITFAHVLRDAGYETGFAGKWYLSSSKGPEWSPESFGFEDKRFMWNRGNWKHIEECDGEIKADNEEVGDDETHSSDWLTRKAIDFIQEEREKPFLYMLSYPDPQPPYNARPPYTFEISPSEVSIPETFLQKQAPDWFLSERERGALPVDPTRRQAWNRRRTRAFRAIKAQYLGMVKHLDDCIGRVIDALEERGELENTMIVFTSDHGDMMGDHGILGTNLLYEPAYRIPLIIRSPGLVPMGASMDKMMSTVDFMPTLLELVGVGSSGTETGRNAAPLVRGTTIPWEEVVYLHPYGTKRVGVLTPDFLYGFQKDKDALLINRKTDPLQKENLIADPHYLEKAQDLHLQLMVHFDSNCPVACEWEPRQTDISMLRSADPLVLDDSWVGEAQG